MSEFLNQLMAMLGSFLLVVAGFIPLMPAAAPLVSLLVDLGKKIKIGDKYIVGDGNSGRAQIILNALLWIILYLLGYYGLGETAQDIVENILPVIVGLILQIMATAWAHRGLRALNVSVRAKQNQN